MTNGWLDDVGFVPLLDEELLKLRQALHDKAQALSIDGHAAQAAGYTLLLDKLGGLHGQDYKLVPLSDTDRDQLTN